MSGKRRTSRIVLRLDPLTAPRIALPLLAELARALPAELAARLIEDERLLAVAAFGASSTSSGSRSGFDEELRRSERALRRMVEDLAERADATWSFDVVRCAGVLAAECTLHPDDLLAIALPEIERAVANLQAEVMAGLARTAGVLLLSGSATSRSRPVVGVVTAESEIAQTIARAIELAAILGRPLAFVISGDGELLARVRAEAAAHWGGPGALALHQVIAPRLDVLAAEIHRLGPSLVVTAPQTAHLSELLARPRLLREIGAPILLLGTAPTL